MSLRAGSFASIRSGFVPWDATLESAAGLVGNARVIGLPVVDDDRHVVGWISQRELMPIVLTPRLGQAPVADYMSPEVIVADQNDSLTDLVDLMQLTESEAVTVVANGICLGVVTRCDILRFVSQARRKFPVAQVPVAQEG